MELLICINETSSLSQKYRQTIDVAIEPKNHLLYREFFFSRAVPRRDRSSDNRVLRSNRIYTVDDHSE